tara:strand:- start:13703 stop:15757 length:2055 start_codon:yes stop_codon:yes gene_type:complete
MKKQKRISKKLFALATFLMAGSAAGYNWVDGDQPLNRSGLNELAPNQVEYNFPPFYQMSESEKPFQLGSVADGSTYVVTDSQLNSWGLAGMEDYGTFDILVKDPSSGSYLPNPQTGQPLVVQTVRHGQYIVGQMPDGTPALGTRIIPVVDNKTVEGAKIMDDTLRAHMGLDANDKIFAPIIYFHPEYPKGSPDEFARKHRLDDGFTHKGAYIGKGLTRNAPYGYHSQKWGTGTSYPAHVIAVNYAGAASQADFNKNAYVALRLLNETGSNVKFSRLDYEKDYFDGNNLKNIMDFYRGWIDHSWIRSDADKYSNGDPKPFYEIMMDDLKYDTYCAEHITMVLNVALNLVQTEEGYIDLFGSDSEQQRLGAARQLNDEQKGGEYFFKKAKEAWAADVSDEDFPVVDNSKVTPLWKMAGSNTHPVANADQNIAKGDVIKAGQAPLISVPGYSMAWEPQTLTDMVSDLMALYGRFDNFDDLAAMNPEMVYQVPQQILTNMFGAVNDRVALSATPNDTEAEKEAYMAMIQPILVKMQEYGSQVEPGNTAKNRDLYARFRQDVAPIMEKFRDVKAINMSEEGKDFFYYTPPPTINRILQGNHRHNRHVDFKIIGTAISHEATELAGAGASIASGQNEPISFSVGSVNSELTPNPVNENGQTSELENTGGEDESEGSEDQGSEKRRGNNNG